MENWRKFVKEAAGDIDLDGDVDPHDVAKLATQVAAQQDTETTRPEDYELQSSIYKRELYKRLNQSNKSRTDILMELLVATLTQPDADFMRNGFNDKSMQVNDGEFEGMKYELCEDVPELCSELESITSEQFTLFLTDNPNILSRYLNRPSSSGSSDRENYNLASSVMQHDDSIPLQKKIPSGYGTRGGKKSGQLEFTGLG